MGRKERWAECREEKDATLDKREWGVKGGCSYGARGSGGGARCTQRIPPTLQGHRGGQRRTEAQRAERVAVKRLLEGPLYQELWYVQGCSEHGQKPYTYLLRISFRHGERSLESRLRARPGEKQSRSVDWKRDGKEEEKGEEQRSQILAHAPDGLVPLLSHPCTSTCLCPLVLTEICNGCFDFYCRLKDLPRVPSSCRRGLVASLRPRMAPCASSPSSQLGRRHLADALLSEISFSRSTAPRLDRTSDYPPLILDEASLHQSKFTARFGVSRTDLWASLRREKAVSLIPGPVGSSVVVTAK